MKKFGFTLAEVLITLTIIGVIAAITMPALMTNATEAQYKTAFKKALNTLSEAGQASGAIDGFDYASLNTTSYGNKDAMSLYGLLANRTQIDLSKSGKVSTDATRKLVDTATNNYVVFFRDGTSLAYNATATTAAASRRVFDGQPWGFAAVVDVNGARKPNQLSNCSGNRTMRAGGSTSKDTSNRAACDDDGQRVIRDQFSVRFRGSTVIPNGAASSWVVNNN